ncbi:glycosyltransferase family 2 protein [Haloarcula argentinensis]|uniref:Glycosyltransferase n=1 Tax=Haloarcula argentinensis TaxID=43776 RepID=A0A847URX6_HALAR|nr:glycosyltransferase family A protein [Haloarcula argentinensis]NLV15280.1 glycosyltransferase [Haloarcula argentinensis]
MTTLTEPPNRDTWPLVSVVVPTYGRDEYLEDALRSVTEQTYDNIELFVVDDGSSIPITETIDEEGIPFENLESVTFIRHNENRGANVARNNGIRSATGEFIAFLDDDDWWHEEKIARGVNAFLTGGENVGLVYNGKQTEGADGTTKMIPSVEGDVVTDLLEGKEFGQFSSIMVRSSVIDEAGLPDERFPSWQDREWLFRIAQYCEFKPIPEILTYRRVGHADRITRDFQTQRDVTYPMFVEKHEPLAAEYGWYYRRAFLASLRLNLARTAVRADEYEEARKYFWRGFAANPLYRPLYPHLLPSLGGKWTYKPVTVVRKQISKVASLLG